MDESTFDVFAIKQFRWLFLGNVAFFFAMQGQMLTRSLLAWELTGEATALAFINLVVAVPLIIASLIGLPILLLVWLAGRWLELKPAIDAAEPAQ